MGQKNEVTEYFEKCYTELVEMNTFILFGALLRIKSHPH